MSAAERAITALLELMAQLRDPHTGCPWDRQQSFATIAPYTIEEAYEVADAIDRADASQLCDELGDLLFQVVFHARLAEERGWFDFAAVAGSIHQKLVRRHPHVFADVQIENAAAQIRSWEELKEQERHSQLASDASALANIPKALPALARAAKIGRRAARVGFDWQHPAQVRDKVLEELREVDEALFDLSPTGQELASEDAGSERIREELGDLLFAIANWSVHLHVDPEEALRAANVKFERRFRHMEALAAAQGVALKSLSFEQWDELWSLAKQA